MSNQETWIVYKVESMSGDSLRDSFASRFQVQNSPIGLGVGGN